MTKRRVLENEDAMRAFAAQFARGLKPGDVVALSGPLGSGKTTFVRFVVEALHGSDQTTSPTFTFRHRYAGTPAVEHIDLFRVGDSRELFELGLEEAFDGESVVLVEWWRNAPQLLPARRFEIEIAGAGDAPRTLTMVETP